MYYNSKNINHAKSMRSNMTKEESILWNILRAKRFYGFKFKRQVLIGDYIVDFLCLDAKLIIELDGGQHNEPVNMSNDNVRTEYLESKGYKVLRFWNNEVRENLDGVLEVIKRQLLSPPSGEGSSRMNVSELRMQGEGFLSVFQIISIYSLQFLIFKHNYY